MIIPVRLQLPCFPGQPQAVCLGSSQEHGSWNTLGIWHRLAGQGRVQALKTAFR